MPKPLSPTTIYPSTIGTAITSLRFDRVAAVSFQLKPSVGIVARDIDKLGLAYTSFREPLARAIKLVMIPSIRKNFDVGGRPPWEPLAEATIEMRGGEAWPILRRTGKLRRAATSFKIWEVGKNSATIRKLPENVWYGYVHQMGIGGFGKFITAAQRELGHGTSSMDVVRRAFELMDSMRSSPAKEYSVIIPKREFVMFQSEDPPKVQAIFYEWVKEKAIKVGRFRSL